MFHVFVPDSELKLDQRVRVLSGGRQLQISSAERTDTASYTCTAFSEAGTTSKVYSLQVYGTYAPSVMELKFEKRIRVFLCLMLCATTQLLFSLQSALPSAAARASTMTSLWQKEGTWPYSVLRRVYHDLQSHGWRMVGPLPASTAPRFWMRGGCYRLKMLRCQTRGATPALRLIWQDRLTASMMSVFMVWVIIWFELFSLYVVIISLQVIVSLLSFSPTKHNWTGTPARKCECCSKEPSCSELRGIWDSSSFHHLAKGWSTNQSQQLSAHPFRWVPVELGGFSLILCRNCSLKTDQCLNVLVFAVLVLYVNQCQINQATHTMNDEFEIFNFWQGVKLLQYVISNKM